MKFILISFLFLLQFNFAFAEKIKIAEPAKLIYDQLMEPEAVVLTADGKMMTFRAKGNKFEKGDSHTAYLGQLEDDGTWSKLTKFKPSLLLKFFAYSGLSPDGKTLVSSVDTWQFFGLTRTFMTAFSKEGLVVKGYAHHVRFYDIATKKLIKSLGPKDFNIKSGDRMEHVRMSPDGRWITFYLHDIPEQRGVYLYNLKTKVTTYLGLFDDKHPTWTEDGSKILFHQQKGGNAGEDSDVEMASIGYYDLKFSGDSVQVTRILLDEPLAEGEYRYHKHPALYPGTKLLFFHGKKKPDGSSKIFVRELKAKSKIFELEMKGDDEKELKMSKHPATAQADVGLFFIGKYKDETDEKFGKKIFQLSPTSILEISNKVIGH